MERAQILAHAGEHRRSAGANPGSGRIGRVHTAHTCRLERNFLRTQLKNPGSPPPRHILDLRPNTTAGTTISPHSMSSNAL